MIRPTLDTAKRWIKKLDAWLYKMAVERARWQGW